MRVLAFSNAKQVELFLNGKSLGRKDMPHDDFAEWEVPWQPGQLMAKAYTDGQTVAADTVETTGAPVRIEISPDRTTLKANAEDAVVVPVSILDAQGRVVPDASNHVTFSLASDGFLRSGGLTASPSLFLLGVGNGDPADHDPDKSNQRNAFHGHCMVVIEAGARPGTIQLTASSPGLVSSVVNFEVQ
ncbi:MAG TPA: DUF4982 domain-containing protein [Verrucomicrobiae bacterium]|nr:DUF4982 domain-containing protein [Verrucomicrobiae bacterium]